MPLIVALGRYWMTANRAPGHCHRSGHIPRRFSWLDTLLLRLVALAATSGNCDKLRAIHMLGDFQHLPSRAVIVKLGAI